MISSNRQCEPGTCWAGPLGEACDHWKGETERLRLQVLALENAGMEAAAQLGEAEDAYMLCIELKDEARAEVKQLRAVLEDIAGLGEYERSAPTLRDIAAKGLRDD